MPRPVRILVVDDQPAVRSLVAKILLGEGFEVLENDDGVHAMAECRRLNGEIDLLLTDINMPGMSGVELAHGIKELYPAVRVLYISGQCEAGLMQAEIAAGFGFLSKPFMPKTLIHAAEAILAVAKPVKQAFTPPDSGAKTA